MAVRLATAIVGIRADGSAFNRDLRRIRINTERQVKQLGTIAGRLGGQAAASARAATGAFDGLGRSVFGNIAAFTGLAAGVGAVSAAFSRAIDLDDALQRALSVTKGITESTKDEFRALAKSLAVETGESAVKVAEGFFFLGNAGLDAATSLKALPIAAKLAAAGNLDLATASDRLTDILDAFGLKSTDAAENMMNLQRIADVVVKGMSSATITADQLSQSLALAGGVASNAGKDIEEIGAGLLLLASKGRKGRRAVVELDIVFRELRKAAVALEKEFEVDIFDDTTGAMRKLSDISDDLGRAFGKLSAEERQLRFEQLKIRDESRRLLPLFFGQGDALRDLEKKLREARGELDRVFGTQVLSLRRQLTSLKESILGVAESLTRQLTIAFSLVAKPIRFLLKNITDLDARLNGLLSRLAAAGTISFTGIVGASAAITKLLPFLTKGALAVGNMVTEALGLNAALRVVFGTLEALLTTLEGLTRVARMALEAAGRAVMRFGTFAGNVVSDIGSGLEKTFFGFGAILGTPIKLLGRFIKLLSELTGVGIEKLAAGFEFVAKAVLVALRAIKDFGQRVTKILTGILGNVIIATVGAIATRIAEIFNTLKDSEAVAQAFERAGRRMGLAFIQIELTLRKLAMKVRDAIDSLLRSFGRLVGIDFDSIFGGSLEQNVTNFIDLVSDGLLDLAILFDFLVDNFDRVGKLLRLLAESTFLRFKLAAIDAIEFVASQGAKFMDELFAAAVPAAIEVFNFVKNEIGPLVSKILTALAKVGVALGIAIARGFKTAFFGGFFEETLTRFKILFKTIKLGFLSLFDELRPAAQSFSRGLGEQLVKGAESFLSIVGKVFPAAKELSEALRAEAQALKAPPPPLAEQFREEREQLTAEIDALLGKLGRLQVDVKTQFDDADLKATLQQLTDVITESLGDAVRELPASLVRLYDDIVKKIEMLRASAPKTREALQESLSEVIGLTKQLTDEFQRLRITRRSELEAIRRDREKAGAEAKKAAAAEAGEEPRRPEQERRIGLATDRRFIGFTELARVIQEGFFQAERERTQADIANNTAKIAALQAENNELTRRLAQEFGITGSVGKRIAEAGKLGGGTVNDGGTRIVRPPSSVRGPGIAR